MTKETKNQKQRMFLTCNVTHNSSNDILFLDSTCSNHMTGNKELFSSLNTSIQYEVKFDKDSKVKFNGKGVIAVYAKNGKRRKI